jgi:hypothetical protein
MQTPRDEKTTAPTQYAVGAPVRPLDATSRFDGSDSWFVDTRGLDSVWHTTAHIGAWSITEALAGIYCSLYAASRDSRAAVQLIAPSTAQAFLMKRFVRDLHVRRVRVSTAPTLPSSGAHTTTFVICLPSADNPSTHGDYMRALAEIPALDCRAGTDEIVCVGLSQSPHQGMARQLDVKRESRFAAPAFAAFGDRGELYSRLLRSCPVAQKQIVSLQPWNNVAGVQCLVGRGNRVDKKALCIGAADLPPIIASLAYDLMGRADVLTNHPEHFGGEATTSTAVRRMRDFTDEAILCTRGKWLLVEPELGRGGSHRAATLLMKAPAVVSFIFGLAVGGLDKRKPGDDTPTHLEQPGKCMEPTVNGDYDVEADRAAISTAVIASSPLHNRQACIGKRMRRRDYDEIFDKRLRAVVERLTEEEIGTLLAGLDDSEGK